MNDFLDRQGYRIYRGESFFVIRHYNRNMGCVHSIFIGIIASLALIAVFLVFFVDSYTVAIITLLAVAIYIFEIDRRKRDVKTLFVDWRKRVFRVLNGKKEDSYPFERVLQVVSTTEHIGGFASSDRSTTEEYRRNINILFRDGFILTVFTFISDSQENEQETDSLVNWLEGLAKSA